MVYKGLYSYKDLEPITNKSYKQLKQLSYRLQLFPRQIGGKSYFNEEQLQKIIDYRPPQKKSKSSRRKISIIEEYLRVGSARKVAFIMRIQKELVNKTVKEWEENDECIVVDSSLNFSSTSGIDNIRKCGGKWAYDWNKNRINYYKGGFETEEEAFYELCKLKESLNNE